MSKNSHIRKNPNVNNEHVHTADTAVKTKIENIPKNNIHLCTVDTTVSERMEKRYIITLSICPPPPSQKQATLGKTQWKPHNNVHLCTADTVMISTRMKPCMERGNSAIYPYSPAGAHV
jgi:hypothetical protein